MSLVLQAELEDKFILGLLLMELKKEKGSKHPLEALTEHV